MEKANAKRENVNEEQKYAGGTGGHANGAREYAIGVDVGGTKINAGWISSDGEVLLHHTIPTAAGQGRVMDRILQAIEAVHADKDQLPEGAVFAGIGVGTAGQVDAATGAIRFASDLLPGYTGTKVKQEIEEKYRVPTFVDNDVNVLAWTELKLGAGRGARHLICLALGTGVGGAIVVDGKLVHGTWGGAAELGHLSVDFNGLPCVCGGIGCLEQYASGTGIAKRMQMKLDAAREAGQHHPASADSGQVDAKQVVTLWQAGDALATEVMDETFAALGAAIASLAHAFNPEVIVIGGGVAEAGEPIFTRIREEANKRGMRSFMEDLRIVPAYQGNWSGMIGAALQVWA